MFSNPTDLGKSHLINHLLNQPQINQSKHNTTTSNHQPTKIRQKLSRRIQPIPAKQNPFINKELINQSHPVPADDCPVGIVALEPEASKNGRSVCDLRKRAAKDNTSHITHDTWPIHSTSHIMTQHREAQRNTPRITYIRRNETRDSSSRMKPRTRTHHTMTTCTHEHSTERYKRSENGHRTVQHHTYVCICIYNI